MLKTYLDDNHIHELEVDTNMIGGIFFSTTNGEPVYIDEDGVHNIIEQLNNWIAYRERIFG